MATAPSRKRRSGAGTTANAAASATEERSFLFYRNIDSVTAEQHGDLCLSDDINYGFAADTNSIPLNGVEFSAAARHYPIIFNHEPGGSPLAVMGVRSSENLFVEDDGSWAEGCYLPAFVRRYPFIFIAGEANAELSFCVDSQSELLTSGGDRALFQNDRSSELLQNIARFCAAYARQQNATRNFVAAVEEQDLLIERSADITLPNGQKIAMRGFRVVDEGRLRNLPPAIADEWRRNGWLSWISSHMVSLGNFGRLYFRVKSRDAA